MRLDLGSTVGTQSALGIAIKQPREKIPRSGRHNITAGEGQGFLENLAVHLIGVLVIERWQASKHLVKQDTKRPPIHRLRVAIAKEQFRGKVLGGSAES